MTRRQPEPPPHPAWQAFAARHEGHPFLAHDPLFALSENVIDAIAKYVPGFFTSE